MRKMKDSGVAWLEEIPAGWEVRKLKYSVKLKTDSSPDMTEKYIGLENIESWSGRYISTDTEMTEDSGNTSVSAGDVLFGGLRPYLAKCYISPDDACCSTEFFVMAPIQFFGKFLHYLLLTPRFIDIVTMSIYGAKMPRTNWKFMGNTKFPLPPAHEQSRIVAFLDDKCAEIDALAAVIQDKIDALELYKRRVITDAVTKGIDKSAPMRDSGVPWIGEIPEDSQIIKLKYLIKNYKAGPFGSALITSELNEFGSILVYTPEHISKKNIYDIDNLYLPDERKQEMSQFFIAANDIILPIVGSLGRAMVITEDMPPGIINQRLAKFRLNQDIVDINYFMAIFSESVFFTTYIGLYERGSFILNLTKKILYDMPIVVPSIQTQRSIVAYLDDKCAQIDETISLHRQQIDTLKEYRQSVIYEYVTGKREVPA